jgi:hypothetical protein
MFRLNDTARGVHTHEHRPHTLAVRTYRQIAEMLAKREGKPISPDRVAHICRAAELKIIDALRADTVLG